MNANRLEALRDLAVSFSNTRPLSTLLDDPPPDSVNPAAHEACHANRVQPASR